MSAKRALGRIHAPDEAGAQDRAWPVLRTAYRAREPVAARTGFGRRTALAPAVAVVLLGAIAFSPAGAAVRRWIGHALGVRHPAPALYSLPAPGRVLVSGPGGTWTVSSAGVTRRLGSWRQASWSPRGIYVAVVGDDELAAVDPHGVPRWTLARPAVSDPRWYSPTGFRIAYLSGAQLRVLAGDGTGDHLVAGRVAPIAPAWRPGHPYELAYVTGSGRLVIRDGDSGQTLWTAVAPARPEALSWSANGSRLLLTSLHVATVYTAAGAVAARLTEPAATPLLDGALSPDGHRLALVRGGAGSDVVLTSGHGAPQRVLSGTRLGQLAFSPDGDWLLVSWPAADQWVFTRVAGKPRIAAVSRIAERFAIGTGATGSARASGFPQLDGWCCTVQGTAG